MWPAQLAHKNRLAATGFGEVKQQSANHSR